MKIRFVSTLIFLLLYAFVGFGQNRNVLIEKGGATWCGHCPRANLILDSLTDANPRIIGVAMHNFDVMDTPEGNEFVSSYIPGFPGSTIDRHQFPGMNLSLSYLKWAELSSERLDVPAPVDLSVDYTYNPSDRLLQIQVNADFVDSVSGDLRLNCYIVEDSIVGGGSYNQRNYYNTNPVVPELNGLGNPIPNYVHNHVLRSMLGGTWGVGGVIDVAVDSGDHFSHNFAIYLDEAYRDNHIRIVPVVQRYHIQLVHREILNAANIQLDPTSGTGISDLISPDLQLFVYPNPVNRSSVLQMELPQSMDIALHLTDIQGRTLWKKELGIRQNGLQEESLERLAFPHERLSPGIYWLILESPDRYQRVKLSVASR